MADINVDTSIDTKRKVGSTTVIAAAGSVAGTQVAQLVSEVFHWNLSNEALLGLATLLGFAGTIIGGYLAPSKGHEVTKVVDKATQNIPTYGDIQAMANSVAASAAQGAYTVQATPAQTQPDISQVESYNGSAMASSGGSYAATGDSAILTQDRLTDAPVLDNPEIA